MADEEKTENTEEETTAEVVEGAEPTGDETPATEPAVEATPEEAPAAAEPAPEEAPAAPAEPEVVLTPKERRQQRRSAAVAKRGPRRASTPEARAELRKQKAASRSRYRAKQKEKAKGREVTPPIVAEETTTGSPKLRTGIVVSDKADKTITVRIETARRHRRYQKTIRSSSTLHAHDEANTAGVGDRVRVVESRPLSATKRWRLVDVLEKAK